MYCATPNLETWLWACCGTRQERSTLQLNAPGLGWLFAELLL